MSCVLSHPISGQVLMMESGRPALLYTNLNNLNIDLATGTRIVLKSYSNLYVLESTDSTKNIYPISMGFVQGSGLPNGLSLYNYNTITGIVRSTGLWKVATNYVYPNNPTPVTKIFYVLVKQTGDIDSYAFPDFQTIFTGNNGEPVFPTINGNDINIPITQNGNIIFIPSGEILGSAPFVDSTGPTLIGGEEPPIEGGGKGDPINIIPLRFYANAETNNSGIITGFSGMAKVYVSRYIDTRSRAENLFLCRKGNKYARIDTETVSGWAQGADGLIQGIKFSQGILGTSGNSYLPYGFETNSTLYFISTGISTIHTDTVMMSLMKQDKNGQIFDITESNRLVDPNNQIPNQTIAATVFFNIQKNIGIDNDTALRLRWEYNGMFRAFGESTVGGSYSFTLGDLHAFDQLGGSLIEHLNYIYSNCPFYINGNECPPVGNTSPDTITDFTGVQIGQPWRTWGRTLKWTELNDKAKHFYGINWIMSKITDGSSLTPVNNNIILDKWKRCDPGWSGSGILITGDIWSRTCKIPGTFLNDPIFGCPNCDPACPNFTGDFNQSRNSPVGCGGNTRLTQHLADCYNIPWSSEPCPQNSPSTTSSMSFEELLNTFENLD